MEMSLTTTWKNGGIDKIFNPVSHFDTSSFYLCIEQSLLALSQSKETIKTPKDMEPITSNDFLNSVLETEAWKEVSQCGSQSSGLPSVECNG